MKKWISIILSVTMLTALIPTMAFAKDDKKFTDVDGREYYSKAADALVELDILAGYEDGSFGAERDVTRAEMAAITCRMLGMEDNADKSSGKTEFDDVNADHWASGYINIATDEGIIEGDGDGNFRPEDNVKYEEAIKMVVCALGLGDDVTVDPKDWSKEYLSVAKYNKITNDLKGSKGKASTRGDIAVMVYNGLIKDLTAPIASKTEGTYSGTQKIELTTPTKNASIYYTTDGSAPTTKSTKYTSSISISKTSTLRAIAVLKGILVSDELKAIYTIKSSRGGGGGGSSSKTTYSLTFAESKNGTINTDVTGKYVVGKKINLIATPEDGYKFVSWSSDNGGEFENSYSSATVFTMPSNNVVITATFILLAEDSDNDGVSADIETLFGTDETKEDTDGDGLSDYTEIYISETDPLLSDTDGNGITDGDEDFDADGLSNIKEVQLGTNLRKKDSDNDGLTDSDEVNFYGTNPINVDSDNDGIIDGDEILLGLNPLVDKTDGVTMDSERKFEQTISQDSISEELLSDYNNAVPSLTATTTGNINRSVYIEKSISNDFSDSRALVGEAIDICGNNIENAVLSFNLTSNVELMSLEDSNETFNTNLICQYNEDGSIEYLDTNYDASSKTISATIDGEGTYYVLDVSALFDELGLSMPTVSNLYSLEDDDRVSLMNIDESDNSDNQNNQTSLMYDSAKLFDANLDYEIASTEMQKVTLASSDVMAQADIVFIIDTTGSMGDEISNVKNNIGYFVDALKSKGVSAGLALVEYRDIDEDGYDTTKVHKNGSSNWFYDMDKYKTVLSNLYADGGGDTPESVVDALETARLLDMRASAGKIFVLVTDADYKSGNRYGIPSMASEIQLLKNAGVSCSVVTTSYERDTYFNLYNETNGIYADINGNFYNELMSVADKIGDEIVGDGYWIYLQAPVPVPVRLDEAPYAGSKVDTDSDGVYDIDELESVTPTGEINLDEIINKVSHGAITGTDYGIVKTYKYKSNPTLEDTDFDGTVDSEDTLPKSNNYGGVMHYNDNKKTCNIDFKIDYRELIDGRNTVYSKDLSKLSILFASDVYDGLYIELTEGKKGGNDNATTFGSLLGLNDSRYCDVTSGYLNDTDDITNFYIGHRNIKYNGENAEVIVLSVRGTNGTNAEWSSNFDVGADTTEYYNSTGNHPEWINKNNHKGFDVTANRVLSKFNEYINEVGIDSSAKKYILITGHSRGAAIANLLGKYFEDQSDYTSYTYTFATPNNTTQSNAGSYSTIFNIVNEDDLIPYLPIDKWGFTNFGTTKSISIEKYYENKWWSAEEGTWEWFIGEDYNNDGGTNRTLNCFSKIANSRDELYQLDSSGDGKVWGNNIGHITRDGAEKELNELKSTLEKEKLLKFCNVYVVGGGISYHVEINYSPAYLMQTLSNMTTGTGPLLGHDVKGKYAQAKSSFVASSGKLVIGGMEHPHMQPTYYIIAHNNFIPLSK